MTSNSTSASTETLPGLCVTPEFVSADEEVALVRSFGVADRVFSVDRNRVLRFGPGVLATGYSSGEIFTDVPAQLDALCDRLVSVGLIAPAMRPNAITVNEYLPGQGIEFHTDNEHAGSVISVLGLGSLGELVFRNGRQVQVVPFPPRCLVQMSGACRHSPWKHAIRPVPALRYSVVFRHGAS